MDDLLAELESRDKYSQQGSVTGPQGVPAKKPEETTQPGSRKQNSKMRHLARQVSEAWNALQD